MRSEHTILVVDDHEPTLYAAAKMLAAAGFKTLHATNGEEALARSAAASALLMDVNLPDINGVAVCRTLKIKGTKPVVLMSAVYQDSLHREAALAAGADEYLGGHLDPQQLTALFDRLLA